MEHDWAKNVPLICYVRMLLYYETVPLVFDYFRYTVP